MKTVNIVHLYAKEMNIYGDNGNVLILQQRLAWRGIPVSVSVCNVGAMLPPDSHIIIGGGGQDAGQSSIASDLQKKQKTLQQMRDDGVVMLMICGMYQMFGHYFRTQDGTEIPGISMLDVHTVAGKTRIIGNVRAKSEWGTLVGYENHSGKTYLGDTVAQLGITAGEQGNNGQDMTEGAVAQNVFGTYMHGPLLAKSPQFADYLLAQALALQGESKEALTKLDDSLAIQARNVAAKRPR
mgnify:CR=1 FL=1